VFLFLLKISLSILTGAGSCVLMGFDLFIYSIPYYYMGDFLNGWILEYRLAWGYYFGFFVWLAFCTINLVIALGKFVKSSENVSIIKKTVLELGTQFANLEVSEISEVCNVNKIVIIETILKMIENREIYAEYFKSSKSVAFNKQANIEEIDKLMATFRDWEENLEKKR
jgi:hypothetical protein